MEVSLEVLVSTGIKRKKPCLRLCWLGQEKEAVFLVDEKRVSEVSLRSGNVKKTLLKKTSVAALATSANGAWLAALNVSGELSLWKKDLDSLLTVPAAPEISQVIAAAQETSLKFYLCVSGDGSRVLLATHTGCVYLWESSEEKNRPNSQKNRLLTGRWTKVDPQDVVSFPGTADKEATINATFLKNEVIGDSGLCTFVFYSGTRLIMTFLSLRWIEGDQKHNSMSPYHVHWAQQDCSLDTFYPTCEPVKSRGALVAAFSKDGLVLALAVNQKDPKATCVFFVNTMNFVTVYGNLRGCGSRNQQIPSRYLRSYWVGDMAWTADSLFLVCMLKRGSLLLLTHLGELLTLTTSGCSVEFGPAEFIPLHPLITYRPPVSILDSQNPNDSLGSVTSEADLMRQRFSVTCHPRLPYLVVSDGYMVTALRFTQNMSPYSFMKTLLLDAAQRLENVRQSLQLGKPKRNGVKLRSLASLKATLLKDGEKAPSSVMSTVPSFLQDEEDLCGHLEKLLQDDDDEDSDNEEYLKYIAPSDSAIGKADHGRLEFASMFDTIHASDHSMGKRDLLSELQNIKRTLLTAWATGVTMRSTAETDTLLRYTVGCLTHFLSLFQSPKCPRLKYKHFKNSGKGSAPWATYIAVLYQCLTALHWDVFPQHAMGQMIKLTSEAVKLILVQHSQLYSKSLVESFCLLKTVSQSLSAIYNLHFECVPDTVGGSTKLDVVKTPVFEAPLQATKRSLVHYVFKEFPNAVAYRENSEKRLAVLWRLLYNQTLWYQTRLRKQISRNQSMLMSLEVQSEEQAIISLLCHLQAELQSTGQHLEQDLHLLPVTGEEFFLFGSYRESIEFWRSELVEATAQGGRRVGLLQTRYYLAILYCHLYNYNLNDAQGLCDQLVKELLVRSSLLAEAEQEAHGIEEEQQLLGEVLPEAALTVIQSMGRFMAAYFTNQLLYVFPPHNVCVLAPLHVSTEKFPRVIALQHSTVASAVRDQNLSRVWTVEYALDLLLIGGLIPEAAWLANQLGDWKMAVSMAVAYNLHLQSIPDESNGDVPSMLLSLSPAHIFQEKLQSFLGQPPSVDTPAKKLSETKHFTDPIEEEDADVLFTSVQEMLKAAVMADAEILTESLRQLIESAKELIVKLSGLVPDRLYLPAPPLYCPQPSSVSEEDPSDLLLNLEKRNRQKLSGVLQRVLLLLRAAHCSLPAAQWYIKQIKRARKVMQKIRAKGSLPPLSLLPESLLNYANSKTVFLKPGTSGDNASGDLVSCSVLSCFRELCALCWMLHVRERLSLSCRQYQKARDNGKLFKSSDEYDPCVTERCFEALDWACRMLPFTRVTNCEELVQDLILSLISELPPVTKVAEIMVKAFPHPDEVRVPLREKFHSVQQRLRHAMIKGLDREERMSLVIHNTQRVRVKALKRIQRNIGPVEFHLWEPALDETPETHYYDKYSLGTSLSRSTLTDLGRLCSDTDTLSDTLLTSTAEERLEWNTPFSSKHLFTGKPSKAKREKMSKRGEMPTESAATLPKVGTWEFECDDEEYTNFLDLFLSYLLEKDLIHNAEPGVPFLTAFSQHLREHELNSLAFDVHTTLKRKLGRAEIKSVFRAGSSYKVNADQQKASSMDSTVIQPQGTSEPPPSLCSTVVLGKPVPSAGRYFRKSTASTSVKSGLFGLQDPRTQKSSAVDCNLSSVYTHDQYRYRLVQNKQCTPSEELGIELQTKYCSEIKLVEWMIRWSDRRLFWTSGKAELCHVAPNTAIRVKTSSAAILTSIWLLEKPYLVPPRQYIVAPVIRSAVKPSLRREASVDDDHSELGRGALSTVHEEDSELLQGSDSRASSKISRISFNSPERQYEDYEEKSADETYAEFKATAVEPVPGLSETEDDQDDQLETQRSPQISVSIHPLAAQVENISPEAEHSAEDPDDTYVEEIMEEPHSEPAVYPDSPVHPHSVGSPKPPTPPASHAHLPESASNGGPNTQPAIASDAVRQLFQDEMFRLLQLQQINFMSLMQVVGSSFAALPAIQHIMQQTAQLSGNSMMGQAPPPLQVTIPQDNANPLAQTPHPLQRPELAQASNSWTGAAAESTAAHNPDRANQRLPEIPIPPNQSTDVGRIPSNLGLLSVIPGQTPLPLITPSVSQPMTASVNPPAVPSNINGLPLLKLHTSPTLMPLNLLAGAQPEHLSRAKERPLPREAWGPSTPLIPTSHKPTTHVTQPPSYIGLSRASISNAEEATRWAEPVVKGRSKHSAGDMSKPGIHTHQPFLRLEEKKHKAQTSLLRVPMKNAGMPLLRLHADPSLFLPPMPHPNFPVSLVPPSGGSTDGHLMEGRPASFTLLKVNLPQAIQSLEISPAPRLIPLQNLIAHERDMAQREKPAEGSMQLLKANIQPFEEVVTPGDSIKRQKRRAQQEKKEKKASVTFRPEESIIIPNNFDEVVQAEKEINDEPNLKESNDFVIPPGTFESALSDPIPAPLLPTMAELHYLASLTKNPPKVQDASTSTGPAPRSVLDMGTVCDAIPSKVVATSASPPEAGLPLHRPPELFLNLPYDEQQKTSSVHRAGSPPVYSEEGPLTVMDLDGEEFPTEALDVEENLPSAADLHFMAAAKNVLLPQLYHDPENFSSDLLQSPPRLEDRMAGGDGGFTQRALSGGVTPASSGEPALRARTPRAGEHNDALSRLREMDAQLRALQNMADSMERDFANTDLLVNTIENLASVVDPDLNEDRPSRGPADPSSELHLSDGILEEVAEEEEEEFSLPSPKAIRLQERPLQVFISSKQDFRPKTDPAQHSGTESRTVNDQLQMTGLSDFADILGDLMAGGVSPAELGLSKAQAEVLSRQRPRHTSKRSQKERAELRMWMRRKQRERLAEHRRQLEELREREHHPFRPQQNANTLGSSKTIQQSQRTKSEKDRLRLSEHHMNRVSDAMSLMQEMLSDQIPATSAKPSRPQTSPSRPQGAQSSSRGSHTVSRSQSAGHTGKKRSPGVLQPRSLSASSRTQFRGTATFVLPKSGSGGRARSMPSYSVTRRYDPALPGDRMSQITRRGILSGRTRNNLTGGGSRPILKTTSKPLTPVRQDKRSKGTSPPSPMQEEHDRDVLSPWELPDDINRILNSSRNSIISQGSLFNGDVSHHSTQDNASESTGSILSKLDWTAIEDMVASVGNA